MRLTRLSPSFRGGGAVGRWSLLIHTQQKGGAKKSYEHTALQLQSHDPTHTGKKIHVPQKLGSSRSHFDDATRQALTFHHRRHGGQTVPLHQSARHPRGCGTLPWRHYDSQAVVAATAHSSAPGIYHETDQEAEKRDQQNMKSSGFNIIYEQLSLVQCGFLCSIMQTKRRTLQNTPPVFFAEKKQQS